jgi:hypothetical protein
MRCRGCQIRSHPPVLRQQQQASANLPIPASVSRRVSGGGDGSSHRPVGANPHQSSCQQQIRRRRTEKCCLLGYNKHRDCVVTPADFVVSCSLKGSHRLPPVDRVSWPGISTTTADIPACRSRPPHIGTAAPGARGTAPRRRPPRAGLRLSERFSASPAVKPFRREPAEPMSIRASTRPTCRSSCGRHDDADSLMPPIRW